MSKILIYKPVKIKDRKPDYTQRLFFYNSRTEGGYISEYIPNEQIEVKKGKIKELKDIPNAIEIITGNFTHWLEAIEIDPIHLQI